MPTIIRTGGGGGGLSLDGDTTSKTATLSGENFDAYSTIVVPYSDGHTYEYLLNGRADLTNGKIHKLGTLYVNSTVQPLPTNPVSGGDIYDNAGSTSNTIEIKDTLSDDNYKLQWVEVNYLDEQYLICDRNIVCNISWDRLNTLGFGNQKGSNKKTITIDGQSYELFMMTGGKSSTDTNNDWSIFVDNVNNYDGLGQSDDVWHYDTMYSMCSDINVLCTYEIRYKETSTTPSVVLRGLNPPKWLADNNNMNTKPYNTRTESDFPRKKYTKNYGWRPCLRVIKES